MYQLLFEVRFLSVQLLNTEPETSLTVLKKVLVQKTEIICDAKISEVA
jgi:hypothetical protein